MDKKNNVLRSILIAVIAGVLLSLGKGIRHTSSIYGDLSSSVSPGVTVSVTETAQAVTEAPHESAAAIDPGGIYTSAEDVALYIHSYGTLPGNFITKKEAKDLGWSGGSLEGFAPGKCIGGDYFGNYEGLLPDTDDYHECDIDTLGKNSRGAKRLIYSSDGRIYYTEDHYSSFKQLY